MGSPPRVRVKLLFEFVTAMALGITPARAGKTTAVTDQRWAVEDHPRACG